MSMFRCSLNVVTAPTDPPTQRWVVSRTITLPFVPFLGLKFADIPGAEGEVTSVMWNAGRETFILFLTHREIVPGDPDYDLDATRREFGPEWRWEEL